MGEVRSRYKILVRKSEGKVELGRPRHRQEVNIKIDLKEIDYEGVDSIKVALDMVRWQVNKLMNLQVP
jgi:hypothetical protein